MPLLRRTRGTPSKEDIISDAAIMTSRTTWFPSSTAFAATESAHLNYLEVVAKDLVERNWDAIEKVAAALLEKETLDGINSAKRYGTTQNEAGHPKRSLGLARPSSVNGATRTCRNVRYPVAMGW